MHDINAVTALMTQLLKGLRRQAALSVNRQTSITCMTALHVDRLHTLLIL